jgi:LacI family transcriptional regulator
MVATIKELAKLAGVTETTVSLSFQNRSRISDKTRKRIMTLARKAGYVPNLAARRLRNGKSKTRLLGMLVPDITNPFFAYMVRAAEKVAAKRGYGILISDSQWQAEKEVKEIETLIENRTDGVLACLCEKTAESLNRLDRFGLPYLLIDTCPQGYPGPYVANDLAEAGRLGVQHLAGIGCRHLAFVTADPANTGFSSFRIMHEQFESFCREQTIDFSEKNLFQAGLTIEAGQRFFDRIITGLPDVDGIFCVNTLCALGILDAARRAGKKLAVMGVDDLEICALSLVSLTTIRQPYEQLAQIAADVLITSIEEQKPPDVKMSLKPELIIRESTRR